MPDEEGMVTDPAEVLEAGYFGKVTDPTPNENYTVEGVASGAPTPETDAEAARAAGKPGVFIDALETEQPPPE